MTHTAVPQQPHKTYLDDIDDAHSQTARTLAMLLQMMMRKRAVNINLFADFHGSFQWLYLLTGTLKEMTTEESDREAAARIEGWLRKETAPGKSINPDLVHEGKALFMEWAGLLEKRGIHTLR